MDSLGKKHQKRLNRALQSKKQQIQENIRQPGSTLIQVCLMMVNLQGWRINQGLTYKKAKLKQPINTQQKCKNRGRWVGSGLKVTSLWMNMNIHHDLDRINSRNLNEPCRSMKKETKKIGITSIRHLQLQICIFQYTGA